MTTRLRSLIARRLQEARYSSGMSLRDASNNLPRHVQISHASIHHWECGTSCPTVENLVALAQLYQRPLTWFVEETRSTCTPPASA